LDSWIVGIAKDGNEYLNFVKVKKLNG